MRILALTVPSEAVELAADRLWAAGAQAVEERDSDDGRVELRTSLGSDDAVSGVRLGVIPVDWSCEFVEVDPRPAETWREFARPIAVSERLVIRPAWQDDGGVPGVLDVAIEPGGSFGLGDHPTTRSTARVLDDLVRPGHHVLDVGCGSGVLAIVAALRGAARVVAIDIAESAREATDDNSLRNGVADVVEASTTPLGEIEGQFDLVLANILAPTLVSLAPDLRRVTAEHGRLVISGVLSDGYDHVVAALAPMRVVANSDDDGWSAVTLAHRWASD
jgi:ribosomal protein L11 methyltransferase